LILVPPVMLVSMVPISIAGWGVREGAMITAFGLVGLDTADALALSIVFGVIVSLVGAPGGAIWALTRPKRAPEAVTPAAGPPAGGARARARRARRTRSRAGPRRAAPGARDRRRPPWRTRSGTARAAGGSAPRRSSPGAPRSGTRCRAGWARGAVR